MRLGLEGEFEREVYAEVLGVALDRPDVVERIGVRPGVTRATVEHFMTTDPELGRALDRRGRFLVGARRTQAVVRAQHRKVVNARRWAQRNREVRGAGGARPWWRTGTRRLRGFALCCVLLAAAFFGRSVAGVVLLLFLLALGAVARWRTDPVLRARSAVPGGDLVLGVVGAAAVLLLGGLLLGGAWPVFLVATTVLGAAVARHPASREGLGKAAEAVSGLLVIAPALLLCEIQLQLWRREFRRVDLAPDVHALIEDLLHSDPAQVWIPRDATGLQQGHASELVVPVDSMKRLDTKLDQLQGGTVAVSGPRGAGKSTLLGSTARPEDFSVLVQAPAGYAAHDFLLLLFTTVCERYIEWRGHQAPRYDDLSRFRRMLRNATGRSRRLVGRTVVLLLAFVLLAFGVAPGLRALQDWNGGVLLHGVEDTVRIGREAAENSWAGSRPTAALLLLLAAFLLFRLSRASWLGPGLRLLWNAVCVLGGLSLVCWSLVDFLYDDSITRHWAEFRHSGPRDEDGNPTDGHLALLMLTFVPLLVASHWYGKSKTLMRDGGERWKGWGAVAVTAAATVGGIAAPLGYLWHNAYTRPIVLDTGNLPRSALFALGAVLLNVRVRLRHAPDVPDLVQDCRTQLLRLRTVQTATTTLTGTAPVVALGSSHAASVTSLPPRFPELVEDFRNLLARIALAAHEQDKRVVIAVDELDRLGTDTRALEFLGEIKAVLGIPHVHFLLSVAEDVGAAFIRRGLPHRDATDSSLDDVLHVQPCTLEASRAILDRRAEGIPEPYVLLAHALSGGIPRDLIRYARRIVEMQQHTNSHELATVCHRLVVEELADTLAGFRILLGKQEWSAQSSEVLTRFRGLTTLLRTSTVASETRNGALIEALQNFAFHPLPPAPGIPESAVRLVDEATAYAYLALTFLEVFAGPGFAARRLVAAAAGPDGDPNLLAEARQELAVSPHSARTLLDAVRSAWSLPVPETGDPLHIVIPAPGAATP
ncbi:P-loop NTPase fold protein [Streptomyces sp. NPDC052225]|uniref:P-loop NTPase fold protein n=1 Tax=Streptomyces sp. NPDC052225 TaxID=3154949 RepID=UPI00341450C5